MATLLNSKTNRTFLVLTALTVALFTITTFTPTLLYGAQDAQSKAPASTITPDKFADLIGTVESPTAQMVFVDVGQGDAILINTIEDKNVLVDAATVGKAGMIITEALALGAAKLDLVIITHAHSDHVAGFKKVADRLPVANYMDPAYPHTSNTYKSVLEYVQTNNIRYLKARRGRKINMGKHASVEILLPDENFITGTRSDVNSNSTITRVDMGDICVLMLGDAEAETEDALVAGGDRISCPVLKVAHHGAEFSTTMSFLKAMRPAVAIISVGANNRYSHPSPLTLDRLKEMGTTVFRTDLDGSVKLHTDGKKFSITSSKRPEASLPARPAE